MEDIFSRKLHIEEKLAEERRRSELIKGSLAQADELTNNMVLILNQFDERLHKLEDTILPLHRKTKDLQRLQDNIDKTVGALEHVIGYHHTAHDVETILRLGPSRHVGKYLESMERLVEAVNFFSQNNPDSPELNTVNNMYKTGKERLETEFHYQLSRLTKPIQPVRVLEIIEEDSISINSQDYFPEKNVKDLEQIALWLSGPGQSQSFAKSYSEVRSKSLLQTLENLREYMQTFSATSGSRKAIGLINTPKKPANRRASTFSRKASTLLRKESMPSLANMGGKTAHPAIAEEEVVDLELEPFIKMVSGCGKLLKAENIVLQSIIPDKFKRKVFDEMVTKPLNLLEEIGKRFVAFAKQCVSLHDHSSVVNIFPAVKHLKQTSPVYSEVLKSCSEANRFKLSRLIEELDMVGFEVLNHFTDSVKSDPEKESCMPKDGTVHELTSNAMLFMQQLSQNAEIAGGMLAAQQMESQQPSRLVKKCLAQYISDVLAALKLNLENKSRVYLDQALASIFLLNNYYFVLSSLDRHGLLVLIEMATPEIKTIYKNNVEEQKITYIRCWNKFRNHMSSECRGFTIDAQPGAKLKDKEKQAVKDKFKSFNTDLEELVKVQQQWAIPNIQMRSEIRDMVKQKLVPDYRTFRDKYRLIQFTKNIEKYLKYSPEEVVKQIDTLFDQFSSA